ncbi:hypothetical protein FJ434_24920 [Mesorhizobium sp. B2-5-13]|nr:hypothetical protein FJ434_24920 [Mesorhizobium sp. B2-5-13]TPK43431.1 hypothetical protein FJ560_24580 [Mesorhizobium sp. B2-5-5]
MVPPLRPGFAEPPLLPPEGEGKEPGWGGANVRNRWRAAHQPCTKTALACGKPPPIRRIASLPACETGGMHKRAKPRLPYRLRSEGWWLVDPPRAKPAAIVIPFVRPHRARKIHGRGPPIFRRYP